jgi:hypothetical protein
MQMCILFLPYSWIKLTDVPLFILYMVVCIETHSTEVFNPAGSSPAEGIHNTTLSARDSSVPPQDKLYAGLIVSDWILLYCVFLCILPHTRLTAVHRLFLFNNVAETECTFYPYCCHCNILLVVFAFVLCLPEDGDLSPKHVAEFTYMDNLLFHINCVHLLVYGCLKSQFAEQIILNLLIHRFLGIRRGSGEVLLFLVYGAGHPRRRDNYTASKSLKPIVQYGDAISHINEDLKRKVVPMHHMKAHRGVDVYLLSFLTSPQYGGKWWASRVGRFTLYSTVV